MALEKGMTRTLAVTVDHTNMATIYDERLLEVFSTPKMVAYMELAASTLLEEHIAPGQATVGTGINVRHSAATPAGLEVRITATVVDIDRRRVDFEVVAEDAYGRIGEGTHSRFIVEREEFMAKVAKKSSPASS